jgi:hypothetical protein
VLGRGEEGALDVDVDVLDVGVPASGELDVGDGPGAPLYSVIVFVSEVASSARTFTAPRMAMIRRVAAVVVCRASLRRATQRGPDDGEEEQRQERQAHALRISPHRRGHQGLWA